MSRSPHAIAEQLIAVARRSSLGFLSWRMAISPQKRNDSQEYWQAMAEMATEMRQAGEQLGQMAEDRLLELRRKATD